MGTPPTSRENDRSTRPDGGPTRIRFQWHDDFTRLEQEADLIDRLFGEEIAQLFKDTS